MVTETAIDATSILLHGLDEGCDRKAPLSQPESDSVSGVRNQEALSSNQARKR